MSATALARLVDDAVAAGALVSEGDATVIASNLGAGSAAGLCLGAETAGWTARVRDGAGNEWTAGELDEDFAPFAVTIAKPAQPDGTLAVLTAAGLRQRLRDDPPQRRWRVAVLSAPIRTRDVLLVPWEGREDVQAEIPTLNPRRLVREAGADRAVPASLARWLLRRDREPDQADDDGRRIWTAEAARRIAVSLANEIDPDTGDLVFRGPPKLALASPAAAPGTVEARLFDDLQEAGSWVYDNERESELRHRLLATEIARSGGGGEALRQFRETLRPSLEGARIAYEMSVSGISADTLKALADLRKAVTDETAKVTEATRQTIGALTGALAVGVGLVAAKLTTATDATILDLVMAVAALYVVLVIASGAQFVLLQRRVRQDWQTTLYRFLPSNDYGRLVTVPTGRAEAAFWTAAAVSLVAIVGLAAAVLAAKPATPATAASIAESGLTAVRAPPQQKAPPQP